jgi:hypothetical protein
MMARVGSGDSAGDRSGDLRGAALGAPAGKGAPRPASPSSPLPPLGSRFWALSQSEGGSDDDEDLAPVEERAGRGRHGRGRSAGARSVAAAPALSPSRSAPDQDPDPAGSVDLSDFPPLPSRSPSDVLAAVPGRAALLQVGEFIFPAGSSARPAGLGFLSILAAGVTLGRSSPPLACRP